jgi:hypothetical protein
MRASLILATLFGLLLCSLATLELTELVRLADDTSNDFSLPQSGQESLPVTIRNSHDLRPAVASNPPHEYGRPRVCRRVTDSAHLAKDCLHLLCVIKT